MNYQDSILIKYFNNNVSITRNIDSNTIRFQDYNTHKEIDISEISDLYSKNLITKYLISPLDIYNHNIIKVDNQDNEGNNSDGCIFDKYTNFISIVNNKKTDYKFDFLFKTTNDCYFNQNYRVVPSSGILKANSKVEIRITKIINQICDLKKKEFEFFQFANENSIIENHNNHINMVDNNSTYKKQLFNRKDINVLNTSTKINEDDKDEYNLQKKYIDSVYETENKDSTDFVKIDLFDFLILELTVHYSNSNSNTDDFGEIYDKDESIISQADNLFTLNYNNDKYIEDSNIINLNITKSNKPDASELYGFDDIKSSNNEENINDIENTIEIKNNAHKDKLLSYFLKVINNKEEDCDRFNKVKHTACFYLSFNTNPSSNIQDYYIEKLNKEKDYSTKCNLINELLKSEEETKQEFYNKRVIYLNKENQNLEKIIQINKDFIRDLDKKYFNLNQIHNDFRNKTELLESENKELLEKERTLLSKIEDLKFKNNTNKKNNEKEIKEYVQKSGVEINMSVKISVIILLCGYIFSSILSDIFYFIRYITGYSGK